LSFKYKFIISFVTIEIIFISLIVFFNFSSLNKLSYELIEEKIETGTTLFTELVKTPLVVYDIATLDDSVESFSHLKNIMAVEILDNENRVLSHITNNVDIDMNNFKNKLTELKIGERIFKLRTEDIKVDGDIYGKAKILFELTDILNTINNNRRLTFMLILIEISISILIAYLIGTRLTSELNKLTLLAERISDNKYIDVEVVNSNGDEVSILSKTLHMMQMRIIERNKTLNELVKKLKSERDFHSTLIDAANSMIIIMNNRGEIIRTNKIVEDFTGYSKKELVGKIVWEEIFIPESTKENVKNEFYNLVSGNFPNSYENIFIKNDGSIVPYAWSNSCVLDEVGKVEYVISIGIDITERHKAEETIRALINSPIDSMMLLSINGTVLEVNETVAHRLNSTVEMLKGKNIFNILTGDISKASSIHLKECIETKKPILYEYTYNGYISENHMYPILDTNKNVTLVSIFSRDVTELRKAQKDLHAYITLVNENVPTSHTDKTGIITHVSEALCRTSGYLQEELIGKKHNILRDPKTPSSMYEDMWKTIESGCIWSGEIRNIAKDGSYYWMEATIYPDYDATGELQGYQAIRQDITNKKIIEKLAITDSLTTLYNRRHFDNIFMDNINRAKRDRNVFFLMLLDVDYFKLYNDRYGHPMGDEVLKTVGKVIKENVKRAGDFAFRLGGEEFGVIYTSSDKKDGYIFADKIRKSIEHENIEHKDNIISPYVTASFGVVFIDFSKNEKTLITSSTLYKSADNMLYKAKESGRNRVLIKEQK